MSRGRSLSMREMRREKRRKERVGIYEPTLPPAWRPRTRGQCPSVRPCPYVACRYHLLLDVRPTGNLKFPFGLDADAADIPASCALDVAADGPHTLEYVAELLNLTRERVRQIEDRALQTMQVLHADLQPGQLAMLETDYVGAPPRPLEVFMPLKPVAVPSPQEELEAALRKVLEAMRLQKIVMLSLYDDGQVSVQRDGDTFRVA